MRTLLACDQSYTRSGIVVMRESEVLFHCSVEESGLLATQVEKRVELRRVVRQAIEDYHVEQLVVERVRLHRSGQLNLRAAFALYTLLILLVDLAYELHIPVVAVDTRRWKASVLGNGNATKDDAVWYAKQVYGLEINNDIADALCMGIYASSFGAVLDSPTSLFAKKEPALIAKIRKPTIKREQSTLSYPAGTDLRRLS